MTEPIRQRRHQSRKDKAFAILALIMESPRSHTELCHLTKQKDQVITDTIRRAQAANLIRPCGQRIGEFGRPQQLFGRAA